MVGMVSPMLAIAEPSARLRLIWVRPRRAALSAAIDSGSSTSSAMITPTTAWGSPSRVTASSIGDDSTLARPTTATSETTSRPRLISARRSVGRSACSSSSSRSPAGGDRQEEVAVPHRLGDHEHAVEQQRGHGREGQLATR